MKLRTEFLVAVVILAIAAIGLSRLPVLPMPFDAVAAEAETVKVILPGTDTGSGVMLSDRLVLTVKHVVVGTGEHSLVDVRTADSKLHRARILWMSARPGDYAMLQLEDMYTGPVAKVSCDLPKLGETLYAIGWSGDSTNVTMMPVLVNDAYDGDGALQGGIQVAGQLSPGMSGGPVFNSRGEVVGLSDILMLMVINMGFEKLPMPNAISGIIPTATVCGYGVPSGIK